MKTLCIQVCLSFLLGLELGFGQQPSCENPPENATVTSDYEAAWLSLIAKSNNISVGATIPVIDIPIKTESTSVTNEMSQRTEKDYKQKISEYLHTSRTLMVAECGYRTCLLTRQGASRATIDAFLNICKGDDGSDSTVRFKTEHPERHIVKQGQRQRAHTFVVDVVGSSDGRLSIACKPDDTKALQCDKANDTKAKAAPEVTRLKLTAAIPRNLKRGEPVDYTYALEIGKVILVGAVGFNKAVDNPTCQRWSNDRCQECGFWTTETKQVSVNIKENVLLACTDMRPGRYDLRLRTTATAGPGREPPRDIRWKMDLGLGYKTSSHSNCDTIEKHSEDPMNDKYSIDKGSSSVDVPKDGHIDIVACSTTSEYPPDTPSTPSFTLGDAMVTLSFKADP